MTDRRRSAGARVARLSLAVLILVGGVAAHTGVAYAAGRVSPSPATSGVTEGQSYDVVFTLDAPIIAPMGDPNPSVTLTFTPQDPSRLSFSPPTIEWDASAWFQTRTLQVTAVHDGIHDASNVDVVQVTATSDAEYYSNYTTSFTVNITDIDPGPPTTTTTTTTPSTTTSTAIPTTTSLGAGTTIMPTTTSTSTTLVAVAPDQGSLPATGAPLGSAAVVGGAFVVTGLLLIRPKRRLGR